MDAHHYIIDEVPGLYQVLSLKLLRETHGVVFDTLPLSAFTSLASFDRVLHAPGAFSPGSVGDVERPWYYHPHQADNLLVLHGTRYIDLYTPEHGRVESFVVAPDRVEHGGKLIAKAGMLVWPCRVFHRVRSCEVHGSASLNLAAHYPGFDVKTNFNIYDLDTETGESRVIREGHLDQF
jgi:hypothetical protein